MDISRGMWHNTPVKGQLTPKLGKNLVDGAEIRYILISDRV